MSQDLLVRLEIETCCHEGCAVVFGVNAAHQRKLRETPTWFWCPNGHQQYYKAGKSEAQVARERAEVAEKNATYWRNRLAEEQEATRIAQRRTIAYQGHLGKLKKRIANGVCPCCKRTFGNVARHIASQHPDYSHAEFVMPRPDERPEPVKAKGAKVTA